MWLEEKCLTGFVEVHQMLGGEAHCTRVHSVGVCPERILCTPGGEDHCG